MSLYSHSRLNCFEQCPLKFKFAYIDKVETEIEDTVEAFLGSRVHEALEKLYKDLKFQKLNTLKELLAFFNSEWTKNWNDAIVIVRKDYDQENYRKMGEKFITGYYNRYKPFNGTKTIGLETQNTVALNDKHKIHIRIDRLSLAEDTVYEIHDYKTSNSLPTQEYLDNDRQLAVYAYGIKKMYPDASKVKLVWHFLAFDKEMSSSRTPEQLEKLKKEVIELIEQIEACKDFPSKTSKLCDWCEFQMLCPEWKHKIETDELKPNEYLKEDGVNLVNEFAKVKEEQNKLDEKLEKIREALVEYAKKEKVNMVFGSDVKASVRAYPKLSFPKKHDPRQGEFFKVIKKIGLWDKLATVDVYELAKMINKGELHGDLMKLLDKFITKSELVRVGLRKK
ncbi:MAG: PD-(D/E)XK nuclease family protein [Nanoarchaeota archaeon]|nr:PD-(D/E)XK nuclease family protein [Nanoarchaeota archaeon]